MRVKLDQSLKNQLVSARQCNKQGEICLNGRKYQLQAECGDYRIVRCPPAAGILKPLRAICDFFSRGFSTATRAADYTAYINSNDCKALAKRANTIQAPAAKATGSLAAPASAPAGSCAAPVTQAKYSTEDVNAWLFQGSKNPAFPPSKLNGRNQAASRPTKAFQDVPMTGTSTYDSRIGVYEGKITDLYANGSRTVIGTLNNGDLLIGSDSDAAAAVIHAAGAGLQAELYNKYGVPKVRQTPAYGKDNYAETEGRGYSISCHSHDMKDTHGIAGIELMTVPMESRQGIENMYREALEHARDMDYIALPQPWHNTQIADIALAAVIKFIDSHPDSKLKIVFVIYNAP